MGAHLLVRLVAEELLSVQLEGVGDEEAEVDLWMSTAAEALASGTAGNDPVGSVSGYSRRLIDSSLGYRGRIGVG